MSAIMYKKSETYTNAIQDIHTNMFFLEMEENYIDRLYGYKNRICLSSMVKTTFKLGEKHV